MARKAADAMILKLAIVAWRPRVTITGDEERRTVGAMNFPSGTVEGGRMLKGSTAT